MRREIDEKRTVNKVVNHLEVYVKYGYLSNFLLLSLCSLLNISPVYLNNTPEVSEVESKDSNEVTKSS